MQTFFGKSCCIKQTKQKAIDLISQCTDKESEAREMNLLKIIQLIRGQAGLRI